MDFEHFKEVSSQSYFFCKGENLLKNPGIVDEAIKEGHSIGNHSYSHINGWQTSTSDYIKDIDKARKVIVKGTKGLFNGLLFRPPYGKIKPRQAKVLIRNGYKIVMLDVVSGDFDQKIDAKRSLKKVLKHTKSGSIVVFHDNKKSYRTLKYVLPKALEYWKIKGYKFAVID